MSLSGRFSLTDVCFPIVSDFFFTLPKPVTTLGYKNKYKINVCLFALRGLFGPFKFKTYYLKISKTAL